jgi:hypothetical protein
MEQEQNYCTRHAYANGLKAFYPQDSFFPAFRADLFMDGK